MKKRIIFEETVRLIHEVDVEIENSDAKEAIDEILDCGDGLDDICHTISHIDGVKIIDVCEVTDEQSSEMECVDVYEI